MQLKRIFVTAVVAVVLLNQPLVHAQEATLTGNVVDSSGAVIPGASIVLRNSATGSAAESMTNAQGRFGFASTRPGGYELMVTLSDRPGLHADRRVHDQ